MANKPEDMHENCTSCGDSLELGQIGECDSCQHVRETQRADKFLVSRTWCYVGSPKSFEIAPCSCGNEDTQWSEYEHRIWCQTCKKDFIPWSNGLFDGPIPIHLAVAMGIVFDRFILATGALEKFDLKTLSYVSSVTAIRHSFPAEASPAQAGPGFCGSASGN